eukprot:gnl/TRDRNA2_/TRDRNA2_127348_c2_seq1.p1 gnl/TRDRNA2_/TRDRNA2_127348_c2~~gnl/TRDRNA2_/TRDRNA2_127348_c2_seq1.p1  ORF type:complete len:247 (+),score=63.05 gnl/TRDRNA2_/TRDRNA2_127348_c2_seq1:82-822(+)
MQRLRESLTEARQAAETTCTNLGNEVAAEEAARSEVLRQISAVRAEHVALTQDASACKAVGRNQVVAAELEHRRLERRAADLGREAAKCTARVETEKARRVAIERKLRANLYEAEEAWETLRDELESRNADLSTQTQHVEAERLGAKLMLREAQQDLEASVEAHQDVEASSRQELEAARLWATEVVEAPHTETLELQREADELRLAREHFQKTISRTQALNSGLRAQVSMLQQTHGNERNALTSLM